MKMSQTDLHAGGGAGGPRTTRKPRRFSHSSEDSKKPRGRPRVEPHDETAADRRRTQIRLAQRAYRLRKETTISSLKQRTTELKNIIDDMNSAFARFSEKASSSGLEGLSSELAQQMREAEKTFSQLKERSRACFDDAGDLPEKSAKRSESPSDSAESNGSATKKRRVSHPTPNAAVVKAGSAEDSISVPSAWGYEMVYDMESPTISESSLSAHELQRPDEMQSLNRLWSDAGSGAQLVHETQITETVPMDYEPERKQQQPESFQAQQMSAPLVTISDALARVASNTSQSIRAPYSYAYRESSFARQLQRTTLETACHLIQQRKLKPGLFAKKFQLCQPYGDEKQILKKIVETLQRPPTESLDWRDHPLHHLGGAGTHYTKRPASGGSSPSDKSQAPHSIGPSELSALMNSANEADTSGKLLSISGFEGEWFDPADVEGYLEEKGFHFESGTNKVALAAQRDLLRPRRDSLSLDALNFMELNGKSNKRRASATAEMTARPSGSDNWDFDDSMPDASSATISPVSATFSLPRTHNMVIDVQKLIRELVKGATCLGRCPGYRRRDVDRAFNMSVAVAG